MRIIDKNQDFYDYMQSPTDVIVFDRRGSFLLTKQMVCDKASMIPTYKWESGHRFLLLQCGAAFWLFLLKITKQNMYGHILDYDLELLSKWKDYCAQRRAISFQIIKLAGAYSIWGRPSTDEIYNQICKNAEKLKADCIHKQYDVIRRLDTSEVYTDYKGSWTKKTLTIPLLKACGISALLDPVEVFSAIEEHFSMERTEAEKTEPEGATNDDKIVMHGFDTKTSFRGK